MPDEPKLPARRDIQRLRVDRFVDLVADYCNGTGEHKGAEPDEFFKVMLDLYRDKEIDEKGKYRVGPDAKIAIFKAFNEITAVVKQVESELGLSKIPAIHQHAHVTQNFAMPKALFDTLTKEQKRLIVENQGGAVVEAAPAAP